MQILSADVKNLKALFLTVRGVKVKLAEISWAAFGCKQLRVVPHAASSTADWHVSTTGNPMFSETETRSRLMTVCVVRTGSACKIPLMILCFSLLRPRMVFSKLMNSIISFKQNSLSKKVKPKALSINIKRKLSIASWPLLLMGSAQWQFM